MKHEHVFAFANLIYQWSFQYNDCSENDTRKQSCCMFSSADKKTSISSCMNFVALHLTPYISLASVSQAKLNNQQCNLCVINPCHMQGTSKLPFWLMQISFGLLLLQFQCIENWFFVAIWANGLENVSFRLSLADLLRFEVHNQWTYLVLLQSNQCVWFLFSNFDFASQG